MVKLASARESRMYAPGLSRIRGEYTNAGLYLFATVVLISGFAAEFSMEPKSGLVLLLLGLIIIVVVNVHDLVAHLAGFDYRFSLMEFDNQLALVEFSVPFVQLLGSLLWFLAVLFLFIQEEKGYGYFALEKHALNMIIAGTVLWVMGSIHNSCQIYERADGHVQILQQSVHIPFLMGSLVLLVGSILNSHEQSGLDHHGIKLLGTTMVWMGIFGSLLFFIGGLANVVKVFKMQQSDGLIRLEKLRGGAQERLVQAREGHMPLIHEEHRRSLRIVGEEKKETPPLPTPYKDVLVGQA